MNLRDDDEKKPIDVFKEARDNRKDKYLKYKTASVDVEEHNRILANTFNTMLTHKLKDNNVLVYCVVKDKGTEFKIKATGATVGLDAEYNILLSTEEQVEMTLTNLKKFIEDTHEQYPGLISKLPTTRTSVVIETRTKFFK